MAAVALDNEVSFTTAGLVPKPEQKTKLRPFDAIEILGRMIGPVQVAASPVGHPKLSDVPGRHLP